MLLADGARARLTEPNEGLGGWLNCVRTYRYSLHTIIHTKLLMGRHSAVSHGTSRIHTNTKRLDHLLTCHRAAAGRPGQPKHTDI